MSQGHRGEEGKKPSWKAKHNHIIKGFVSQPKEFGENGKSIGGL